MSLSAAEVFHLKSAPVSERVLPAIRERWSPRSFSSRPVSAADLVTIFEAVRWTASSANEQPWRFLVGFQGDEVYTQLFNCLVTSNQRWANRAQVLMLGVASTKFAHNGNANGYALYDLGAASTTLKIQATTLGISAHSMGGFDHAAARETFQIPEEYALGAVIALGYQGEPDLLGDEQLIAREVAPRERKLVNEFVFAGWGVPAQLS